MKVENRLVANRKPLKMIHMDTRKILLLVLLAVVTLASGSPDENTTTVTQNQTGQAVSSQSASSNLSLISTNKSNVSVSSEPIKVNERATSDQDVQVSKVVKSRWSSSGKKSTPSLASARSNSSSSSSDFGGQSQASLLRPSFLRSLIGIGQRQPRESASEAKPSQEGEQEGGGDEEEEEVTQTIMMPMGGGEPEEQAGKQSQAPKSATSRPFGSADSSMQLQQTQSRARARLPLTGFEQYQLSSMQQEQQEAQPKPEASLQLTSMEINGILNDREAPELYREREMSNDGVLVREEQARLGAAASERIQGGFGTPGYGGAFGGGFGGAGMDAYMGQRLAHSASEYPGAGNPSGFHHRFGASASEGYSPDELGASSGRLMQSPNEYSEVGANFGGSDYSSAAGMGGGGGGGGYESADFSPNSGMLYASSGDYSASSMGAGGSTREMMGHFGGGGGDNGGSFGYRGAGEHFAGPSGANGYPSSPSLDGHASEMFNRGGLHSVPNDMGALYGHPGASAGRLMSAGSHQPNAFGSSDEFAGRFGQSPGGISFDQRGFATQNNFMLRGTSMLSSAASGQEGARSAKLVPLSPEIPLAEEVANMDAAASASRETSSGSSGSGEASLGANGFRTVAPPVVHEAIEDEDSGSDGSRADAADGQPAEGGGGGGGYDDDDSESPARSARDDRAQQRQTPPQQHTPNLVLNVPPPSAEMGGQRSTNGYQPGVEFARVGSSGYLAPNVDRRRTFTRKSNLDELERHQQRPANYDPAENPAHAGKYIID